MRTGSGCRPRSQPVEALERRVYFFMWQGDPPPEPLYPQADLVTSRTDGVGGPVAGAPAYEFGVRFSAPDGVDVATVVGDGVVSVGPTGGPPLPLVYLGTDAGPTPTSRFRIDAPGGSWDAADAGGYSVTLAPGRVASLSGHVAPGGVSFASFSLTVPERAHDLVPAVGGGPAPAAMLAGGRRTVVPVTVTNAGTLDAAGGAIVRVRLVSDTPGGPSALAAEQRVKWRNLAPGQGRVIKLRANAPDFLPDGTYRYQPEVLSQGGMELSAYNNVGRTGPTFELRQGPAGPPPDVTPGPPDLRVSSDPPEPHLYVGGRYRYRTTVTVEHVGGSSAASYSGEVRVGGTVLAKVRGKLEPGATRVHVLRYKLPASQQSGDLLFVVDLETRHGGLSVDANLLDNSLLYPVTVHGSGSA